VALVHDALPELAVADIDLGTEIADRAVRAPLVIAAMTGGVDRAEVVRWLATRKDHHDRADWAAVRITDGVGS
jgi:isopentenyl diphosphate isomerase/L-lactate dehydrogenase-like FMN-dependent dehydrogenase